MAFIGLFISFPGRDSTGKRRDSENDVRLVGGYRKGILALEMYDGDSPYMLVFSSGGREVYHGLCFG